MSSIRRVLILGGLVIATGPLSLTALAQADYVDLEAEAAQQASSPRAVPADPYGVEPVRSYPATSYGVTGVSPAATTVAPAPAQGVAAGSGNLGNLVLQVQQLQQEVMRLNGRLEEQAHEIRTLKEQNLQRYLDLDKRLSERSAGDTGSGPVAAPARTVAATAPPQRSGDVRSATQALPGEKGAYDAAYSLVAAKRFAEATAAFAQFLRDYPDGRYAPNAHYWRGELDLVSDPPDLESARQSFALLISAYPNHAKVPDAFYKLGRVHYLKGNREKAREYLDLVIEQYSAVNHPAVKLAREFIAENY